MNQIVFVLLAMAATGANAEIYKCKSVQTGEIEYQPSPCISGGQQQAVVDVTPMTKQEEQQARLKLQAWHEQQTAAEQAKIAAEKEQQQALAKQAELDALNRSATAAEQQALAAQQLAGQIEHQNRLNRYNSIYVPQHTYGGGQNGLAIDNGMDDTHRRRHGHEGRHERRHREDIQHPEETQPQTHSWGGSSPGK